MVRCWWVLLSLTYPATGLAAQAQPVLSWTEDVEKATVRARTEQRLILFYFAPEKEPAAAEPSLAAADAGVAGLLQHHFVAVRLRKSSQTEVLVEELQIPGASAGSVAVCSPRGVAVGSIPAAQAVDREVFHRRVVELYDQYRAELFAKRLAPVLDRKTASPDEIMQALDRISDLRIADADEGVSSLLQRENLPDAVRAKVYNTLVALSTDRSAAALLDAAVKDPAAAVALQRCTPQVGAALLQELTKEDARRSQVAYDALTAICHLANPQPAGFWQQAEAAAREQEIARLRGTVAEALRTWQQANGVVP